MELVISVPVLNASSVVVNGIQGSLQSSQTSCRRWVSYPQREARGGSRAQSLCWIVFCSFNSSETSWCLLVKQTLIDSSSESSVRRPKHLQHISNTCFATVCTTFGLGTIFRIKGILAVKNHPFKHVFHAVMDVSDEADAEPWGKDEKRITKIVFIGASAQMATSWEPFVQTSNKVRY